MPARLTFLLLSSLFLSAMIVVVTGQDSAAITEAFGACVSDTGVDFACVQGAIADLDLDPSVLAGLASCAGTDLANIDVEATTACVQEKLAGMGSDGMGDDPDPGMGSGGEDQDMTEMEDPEADCAACEACTP